MNYVEVFKNPAVAKKIHQDILFLAEQLKERKQTACIMEICGSHTMAIARNGIRSLLPDNIDLVSGPGCPVCVTGPGYIDAAIQLALKGATIITFGDMINVPGSQESLAQARSQGAKVEVCYSPLMALELAKKNPETEIVFLAIGFETTTATVICLVDKALQQGIKNLSLLTAFKLVPPAISALLVDPDLKIDAFLCPAHVSAIIGANAYQPFAEGARIPCVIAGFEPLDILFGLYGILKQLVDEISKVDNQYERVVKTQGNLKAQAVMQKYLEPSAAFWRGLGNIPDSGLSLKSEYQSFDAEKRFNVLVGPGTEPSGCLCGEVIKGKLKPKDCVLFGTACTPDHPVGPCMVSSEGSCSAEHKYNR